MRFCWLFLPLLINVVIFPIPFFVSEHLSSTVLVLVTIGKASQFAHFVCIVSSITRQKGIYGTFRKGFNM